MDKNGDNLDVLDKILHETIQSWFDRVKPHYVTEDESRQLGVEPEIKVFHDDGTHRIKFARASELDVTYALAGVSREDRLFVESSVNNKSAGFDYGAFVEKLKTYYWRTRHEKPWTHAEFDRFTYEDLMPFEPNLGGSVALDAKQEKADIIRLLFPINPRYEELLVQHPDILRDLVENYCLYPLKRIFAESYRGN